MTDPTDAKLAALTLIEACWQRNDENRKAITSTTDDIDIVVGLLGVAAMAIMQLANQVGVSTGDVIDQFRSFLLSEQAGVS